MVFCVCVCVYIYMVCMEYFPDILVGWLPCARLGGGRQEASPSRLRRLGRHEAEEVQRGCSCRGQGKAQATGGGGSARSRRPVHHQSDPGAAWGDVLRQSPLRSPPEREVKGELVGHHRNLRRRPGPVGWTRTPSPGAGVRTRSRTPPRSCTGCLDLPPPLTSAIA